MSGIAESAKCGDKLGVGFAANATLAETAAPHFTYSVECRDRNGKLKWAEEIHNLVTTEGKNDIIDKYFKGSGYTAGWFMGLKGAGSAAVGDTLASHAGWTEAAPYSGNRPAITFGSTAGGSNTASSVAFAITATITVAGAFICSVNSGTSGKLYSVGDFAASRGVADGDTLNVTATVSQT